MCHLMFSAKMLLDVENIYSAQPAWLVHALRCNVKVGKYRPADLDPQPQGLLFFVLLPPAFPLVLYLQSASKTPC